MMNLMVKSTEVSPKARRRRFTTAEKIRILREADAAAHETGGVHEGTTIMSYVAEAEGGRGIVLVYRALGGK